MKTKSNVKLIILILLAALLLAFMLSIPSTVVMAEREPSKYYIAYTEAGEKLFERGDEVEVGDHYISEDNNHYEVIKVDKKNKVCTAKYIKKIKLPNMSSNLTSAQGLLQIEKRAALFITHNDESYILSDGTESIYGVGGIHDVAREFATALRQEGFIVALDETLHLPHDVAAYRRSRTTADKLIRENNPDVLFDIHRNGAPRSAFDTVVGGVPMSKVRMVVGQANPNWQENYQFALEIKALADEWYPGLIKDIYMGLGTYNQDLMSQALLLEFGSEQVEKERAIASTVPFANVVNGVVQRRALARVYLHGVNTSSFLQLENLDSAVSNSTVFKLLLAFGAMIILFFMVMAVYMPLRRKTALFFKEVNKGLFITRKP